MELNSKIAQWVGFTKMPEGSRNGYFWERGEKKMGWFNPGSTPKEWITTNRYLPKFTQSLDACFKWLVPKLQDEGYFIEIACFEHKGFSVFITSIFYLDSLWAGRDEDSLALALCLAIEKLIDNKEEG